MSESMLAIVFCISTMACANPPSAREGPAQPQTGQPQAGQPQAEQPQAEQSKAGQPAAAARLTAAPATAEIPLDEETRRTLTRHLADGSLTVARLAIRDVRPGETDAYALKGVRIFIEKPDATVRTPVDDPHYAGAFVPGLDPSESSLLNVAPALVRLWNAGTLTREMLERRTSLRATFVGDAMDAATGLPPTFALTIQNLALEVPRQQQ